MQKNPTLLLVGAVALLAGAGLGAWFAPVRASARGPARAAPQPAQPAPTTGDLAPVLAELALVLAELRATLQQPRAAPSSPGAEPALRAPPASASGAEAELAAALQALAASLRGLNLGSVPAGGVRATPALIVPAWVNRAAAFASAGMRQAQDSDDELAWERAMEAFRKKHLFWSAQQVLDAYGKPDEIQVGNGHSTWAYRLPVDEDAEETFTFDFSDGLVFSVEYSY